MNDFHHFFSHVDLHHFYQNLLLVITNGNASFINTSTIYFLEASHTKIKVLVKFQIANTGVVHITSFKA